MNKLAQTKTAIGISVSLALLCACDKKKSSISHEKPSVQEILVDPGAAGEENATEFFKEVKFIKLESSEDNLIGEITKIIFSADQIYILDRFTKTIFIFDIKGKFITKIRSVGEGPGEYAYLKDFNLDSVKNELVLYDMAHQKFLFYELDGTYKKEIRNGLFFSKFFPLGNGLWGLESPGRSNDPSNYFNILIYDQNKNQVVNRFLPIRYPALPPLDAPKNSSLTEGNVLFAYPFCDTLFSIAAEEACPKYVISCEQKFVNAQAADKYNMKSSEAYEKIRNDGKFFFYSYLTETKEWLHFSYAVNKRPFDVYYSKATKKTHHLKRATFDKALDMFSPISSYRDYFVSPVDAQILFSLKEKLTGDIGALAKSISAVDNPVLILCKMK